MIFMIFMIKRDRSVIFCDLSVIARDFGLVKAELNAAMEHRGEQYRADRNGVYTPGACRKCSCVACC